ncbi:MAG TPA: ABC-type transport auxiliary lipoprotein family protein, partial [Steroidobacter sp.]|nr:ABC-type transport auxiliary lipoprotein family protein [Steroidobacter sp.]
GSLLDTDLPVNALYVLAPAPPSEAGNATPVDLAISLPDVAPGLDTNRIAVLTGRQLDYYRAARWGGLTSEVVQTFLVDSFEDQHLFRSVTSDQTRVAGDYILDVALRDFQAEYSGSERAPSVHVKMIGRLIRVVDRELVATIDAEARASAGDNRMRAVAAAFERAAQQVVVELARETAVAVAGDASTLSSARDERNLAASP